MNNIDLIKNYGILIQKMKQAKIIRTRNVVGEIGEFYAINYFNSNKGLPKLQQTLISTKNIDAVSNKGDRYSIKTTTGNTTGAFFQTNNEKLFEYVLIVKLDNQYNLNQILQIDWNTFSKNKIWNTRQKAWNLRLNKKLIENSIVIFQKTSHI